MTFTTDTTQAPLAVFRHGAHITAVPAGDPYGADTVAGVAIAYGSLVGVEAVEVCPTHRTVPATACTRATGRRCIDSDTQVMAPNSDSGQVLCGNCGREVDHYVRPGDTNEIRYITAHTMPAV
jgi:hypothetical protein